MRPAEPSDTVLSSPEVLDETFTDSLAVARDRHGRPVPRGRWRIRRRLELERQPEQRQALIAQSTANNAKHLGGIDAHSYLLAKHFVSSNGEHFFNIGQTVTLGKAGHFKFTASCTNPSGTTGGQQVTFDVTANTTAGLDGNPPQAAGNLVNIHTNSDAMDTATGHTLNAGDFDQVGSASSSTEIAADGQEVDVFYNDGVNWPAGQRLLGARLLRRLHRFPRLGPSA